MHQQQQFFVTPSSKLLGLVASTPSDDATGLGLHMCSKNALGDRWLCITNRIALAKAFLSVYAKEQFV